MNEFLQLHNFKMCESMWRRYMMDRHQVRIPDAQADSRPRKLLLQIMQDVEKSYATDTTVDLLTLNNVVLNLARDVYLRKGGDRPPPAPISATAALSRSREPNALPQPSQSQSIDRDSLLYGGRQSMGGVARPEPTSQSREVFSLEDDRFVPPMASGGTAPKWDSAAAPPVYDKPLQGDEMARRLAGRDEEDELLAAILRQTPSPSTPANDASRGSIEGGSTAHGEMMPSNGPRTSFTASEGFGEGTPIPTPLNASSTSRLSGQTPLNRDGDAEGMGMSRPTPSSAPSFSFLSTQVPEGSQPNGFTTLQQSAPSTIVMDRYIVINGFDRYWQQSPLRYQYTVKIGENGRSDPLGKSLQMRYRNIQTMQVTRLIIPMEILPKTSSILSDRQSLLSCGNTMSSLKGAYQHAASLSFPYVMLSLDGYNDVYDGTNDASRRAFCQMVYSTSYRAPNGRGFVILEPMQEEKKTFYPTPLASLSRLSISIQRPSGALFNQSTDDHTVMQVMYEVFNKRYLRIVLDRYFDMNEFYVGDSIVVQDYLSVQATSIPGSSWRPDPTASYHALNEYINRPEGHELVELGLANDSGFFKSFCIMAPGAFDTGLGTFVLEAPVIAAIIEMNQPTTPCPAVPYGGALMNMSLQNVLSLKLGVLAGDGQAAFNI